MNWTAIILPNSQLTRGTASFCSQSMYLDCWGSLVIRDVICDVIVAVEWSDGWTSSIFFLRCQKSPVLDTPVEYSFYCRLVSLSSRACWWGRYMSGWKSSIGSGTFLQWLAWIQVALSATLIVVRVTSSTWNGPCQRLDFQCFLRSSFTTTQSPGWSECKGVSAVAGRAAFTVCETWERTVERFWQ